MAQSPMQTPFSAQVGAAWRRCLSMGVAALMACTGTATPPLDGGGNGSGGNRVQRPGDAPALCSAEGESTFLPGSFALNCGGCHDASGKSTTAGPNLFAFQEGGKSFADWVRQGGVGMPSFTAQALTDADLGDIAAYFKSSPPSAVGACTPGTISPGSCSGVEEPLHALFETAAEVAPILVTKADGSLVLSGAGRVRGRHENEATFSPFGPLYFTKRNYTFTVEDSLPAGGTSVKFTYKSEGKAALNPPTNFRYWYTRTGNVFHANVDMTKITDKHWEYTVTRNEREQREIRLGDLLEFEFGVFLDGNDVGGRTNYYTDTFRYIVGSGKVIPFDAPDADGEIGGALTITPIVAEPELSFEQVALNVQGGNISKFLEGRRLFHTNFSTGAHSEPENPVFAEQMSKAGPFVNQNDCSSCHIRNGRGAPPEPGQGIESTVVKVFGAGDGAAPHPDYGRQLQDKAVGGGTAEGSATVDYVEESGTFADGSPYSLRKPTYRFTALSGGAISRHSVRVARPLVGMGLLEAIPEEALLQRADGEDCNGDGISGRVNVVADPQTGKRTVGRFGWKAAKVSVAHQVADALVADMGVTTRFFPQEECGSAQASCKKGGSASSTPEVSDQDLERITTYMRLLGVPPRRHYKEEQVTKGEKLFAQTGCVNCHAPTQVTGATHPLAELRNQTIRPYSDLLLHDMGPGLADASNGEPGAAASEWRTPPLWGIGLTQTVSGHTQFLHDGRARSLTEAVLWHGGEAGGARQRFVAMARADREALLAFLNSL